MVARLLCQTGDGAPHLGRRSRVFYPFRPPLGVPLGSKEPACLRLSEQWR
jgi:hypothetical protein